MGTEGIARFVEMSWGGRDAMAPGFGPRAERALNVVPDQTSTVRATCFLTAFFAPEIRVWHGTEPLWWVFWGYGVLVSAALIAVEALALYRDYVAQQQIMLVCFAMYTVWILVSVWRCAEYAHPFWGPLARWLTIAWAGNAILTIVFLQLDLAARYIGH